MAWVPVDDVTHLRQHPGLAASWPHIAALVGATPAGRGENYRQFDIN